MPDLEMPELDKLFCLNSRKYRLNKTIMKAVVQCESSFNQRAYRFEPALFSQLKAKDPFWGDKDPAVVSASYGLAQIMFTTAWALGIKPVNWKTMTHDEFQALAETLYDPVINIGLQAKLMNNIRDIILADDKLMAINGISVYDILLSRYNGGSFKNPSTDGTLRNQKYVDKVWRAYEELKTKEIPC